MLAQVTGHCLHFAIECGTIAKGIGVTVTAILLFIGSVYLLLSAIFGRWMGYLVLMVALTGWLMILSSIWFFGFWSQGPTTPPNQGPRGAQPSWQVLYTSPTDTSPDYHTFSTWPGPNWHEADLTDPNQLADYTQASSAVQTYLSNELTKQMGIDPNAATAVQPGQISIDSVQFSQDGSTDIAVVTAHYAGGGPLWTVSLYKNSGSIPRYSIMFLAGSILLFLLHVPLLDRAEKRRKQFLTGGQAPAWYGPA
jgi:hypothetical protein